ncbi:MAG: hypothetical protein Q9227_000863 [Pyrenula ochraceoflavens]
MSTVTTTITTTAAALPHTSPSVPRIPSSCSSFHWPTSSSRPTSNNLALAKNLCLRAPPLDFSSSSTYSSTTASQAQVKVISLPHPGMSAQDCIKVIRISPPPANPTNNNPQKESFMVKLPRHHSEASAVACAAEGLRAQWAGSVGLGPEVILVDFDEESGKGSGGFVMRFLDDAQACTMEVVKNTEGMKERIVREVMVSLHDQEVPPSSIEPGRRYDPVAVVAAMLRDVKMQPGAMAQGDLEIVERVIERAGEVQQAAGDSVLRPCHNDLHSLNTMFDKGRNRLWLIDFEDMALGDPMWDLGYFSANLEIPVFELADVYGCSEEEKTRLEAFYPLAVCHFATWAATRGPVWRGHVEECMERLRCGLAE